MTDDGLNFTLFVCYLLFYCTTLITYELGSSRFREVQEAMPSRVMIGGFLSNLFVLYLDFSENKNYFLMKLKFLL